MYDVGFVGRQKLKVEAEPEPQAVSETVSNVCVVLALEVWADFSTNTMVTPRHLRELMVLYVDTFMHNTKKASSYAHTTN